MNECGLTVTELTADELTDVFFWLCAAQIKKKHAKTRQESHVNELRNRFSE